MKQGELEKRYKADRGTLGRALRLVEQERPIERAEMRKK
jgi:hypothetical protein